MQIECIECKEIRVRNITNGSKSYGFNSRAFVAEGILILVLLLGTPLQAQNDSCLAAFQSFAPIEIELNTQARLNQPAYPQTMTWYSDSTCILIGTAGSLWIYDIDQPAQGLMLAVTDEERTIRNVTVNPANSDIAFSVSEESIVHILNSNGIVSTIAASGQEVIEISFSHDGELIAVASSDIDEDTGGYWDALVQIWDWSENREITQISSQSTAIAGLFYDPDNQFLLIDGHRSGYLANDIEYWEISASSKIWSYQDLLNGLQDLTHEDPLAPSAAKMVGQTVAVGGIAGFHDIGEFSGSAIHLWDARLQERRLQIPLSRRGDDYSPLADFDLYSDGGILATAIENGDIQFWNVEDGSQQTNFELLQDKANLGESGVIVEHIAFSPVDRFLAVQTTQCIIVIDVEHMEESARIEYQTTS